jgi:hypothetical protein
VGVVVIGQVLAGVGYGLAGVVEQMVALAGHLVEDAGAFEDASGLVLHARHHDHDATAGEPADQRTQGCGAGDVHRRDTSHPHDDDADVVVDTEQSSKNRSAAPKKTGPSMR